MQHALTHTIPRVSAQETLSFRERMLVKPYEKIKWQHRAEKYKYREDRGGIAYIEKHVMAGDTVFDVGAHKGGYLYYFFEKLGRHGKIHAFEPQAILNQYLVRLRFLFGLDNLVIEACAVSGNTGTATLCVPYNGHRQSSPCATIIEHPPYELYRSKKIVPTVSLDNYCASRQIYPDFLKVDVEGNELAVFKGAEHILRSRRPRLLFECETRFAGAEKMKETFTFLLGCGYTGYYIRDNAIIPIAGFNPGLHQDINSGVYCNNFIFE